MSLKQKLASDELSSAISLMTVFYSGKVVQPVAKKEKKLKGNAKEKVVRKALDFDKLRQVEPLCGSKAQVPVAEEKFYITTAIFYTNGPPHIGHAYESITSDCIARYHRNYGRQVFFLTGTDEHGQKVEKAALAKNMKPIELCDFYTKGFQALNDRLLISNDHWIRTTDKSHEELARKIWERVKANGDIYLTTYEGWYNEYEEQYVTELEAKKTDYKDEHGRPFELKSEESYFFRMSKYKQQLLDHIAANPEFIQPAERLGEIMSFLQQDLQDLCISRTVCQWGVQCPPDADYKGDKSHVMYVWFDALTNYLSGVGYMDETSPNSHFWPASVHIIGKDIIRFHTVYWPTMLMSAGIPLPKCVFAHGFVNAADGTKMSKSLGNVVDPNEFLDDYPVDSLRFFLIRDTTYGKDCPMTVPSLLALYNSVVNDSFGNLVSRSLNLCEKYNASLIPDAEPYLHEGALPFDLEQLKRVSEDAYSATGGDSKVGFQLQHAATAVVIACNASNKYLSDTALWLMKGDKKLILPKQLAIIRTALEATYLLAHFLEPIIPAEMDKVFKLLGVHKAAICNLRPDFKNLPPGTKIHIDVTPLYSKLVLKGSEEAQAATDSKIGGKKDKKDKKQKKVKTPAAAAVEGQPEVTMMDIRVGRIARAWNHENADKLYCEEIEVGEDAPRPIASGLRDHYSLDEMQGRLVLVVCNLKPSKLAGFSSNGMVLCAKGADGKVEFVEPPAGSAVGQLVTVDGVSDERFKPVSSAKVKSKSIWKKVAVGLKTNGDKVATWDGHVIRTDKGPCIAATLPDSPIA